MAAHAHPLPPPGPLPTPTPGTFDLSNRWHLRLLTKTGNTLVSSIRKADNLTATFEPHSNALTKVIADLQKARATFSYLKRTNSRTHAIKLREALMNSYNALVQGYNSATQLTDNLSRSRPPHPQVTPAFCFNEMIGLTKAFPNRISFDGRFIIWDSTPVTLMGVHLGTYRVWFDCETYNHSTDLANFVRPNLLPGGTPSATGYIHPHISGFGPIDPYNGSFCMGEALTPGRSLMDRCELTAFFDLIQSLLSTYNRRGPYIPMYYWFSKNTHDDPFKRESDEHVYTVPRPIVGSYFTTLECPPSQPHFYPITTTQIFGFLFLPVPPPPLPMHHLLLPITQSIIRNHYRPPFPSLFADLLIHTNYLDFRPPYLPYFSNWPIPPVADPLTPHPPLFQECCNCGNHSLSCRPCHPRANPPHPSDPDPPIPHYLCPTCGTECPSCHHSTGRHLMRPFSICLFCIEDRGPNRCIQCNHTSTASTDFNRGPQNSYLCPSCLKACTSCSCYLPTSYLPNECPNCNGDYSVVVHPHPHFLSAIPTFNPPIEVPTTTPTPPPAGLIRLDFGQVEEATFQSLEYPEPLPDTDDITF